MADEQQGQVVNQQPSGSFWSRNQKMIIRIIVVAIIIVGAVLYSQSRDEEPMQDPGVTDQTDQQSGDVNGPGLIVDDGTQDTNDGDAVQPQGPDVMTEGETVTVVVQAGEGYTHTARRALAEYLRTNANSGIQAEHKIYIEDYLQKKIAEKHKLFAGSEVSFSTGQIAEAVTAALDLTDSQVQNLSQYVPLVRGLG